jgi:hypothetical protein
MIIRINTNVLFLKKTYLEESNIHEGIRHGFGVSEAV